MNNQLYTYSTLNEKFYEDYSEKPVTNEFYNIVLPKLNENWTIMKDRIFFYVYCDNDLPKQGWKIHLSATLKNITEILDIATDILIRNNISFKFIVDTETYKMTSQKAYPRQAYGKFITIYPKNIDDFKLIISILYEKLSGFEGPYILSDKRYLDCKVIYYRYGGILSNYIYDMEGKTIPLIIDGYGNEVEDTRFPYFSLPEGIDDIFYDNINDYSSILSQDYEILKALKFTNAGGVYLAKRKFDNQLVIIKEARPYTLLLNEEIDSIFIRKEELIKLKELEYTGFVPKVIDSFYDWEHFFIVEEYFDGITLDEFVVNHSPFPRLGSGAQVTDYLITIITNFIKIADFITILHKNNLVYSDWSLENIIITPNKDVKIIDLEGCNYKDSNIYRTVTKGFFDYFYSEDLFASDIYGIGCLLFSCMLKKTNMLDIQPKTIEIFLNSIYEEYILPIELRLLIQEMTNVDINSRPDIYEVRKRLEKILCSITQDPIIKKNLRLDLKSLTNSLNSSIAMGIKGICESKNQTSLCMFPNMPILTSKLNISTGLSGIVRGLNYLGVESYNKDLVDYCGELPESEPIGLYVGIAGIVWTLIEIGEIKHAEELFTKHITNNNVELDYSIFCGKAGIGLLCIKLYLHTNNQKYLNLAENYGQDIISKLEIDSVDCIGYKKGLSGIALFLLYLHIVTTNRSYLSFGKEILLHELKYRVTYDSYNTVDFPNYKGSSIASPYFLEGTSGILSVLLRYYSYTKCNELLDNVKELANSLYLKFTISPTLFKGFAGIANVLLDCFYILGDKKYKDHAYAMARECLQYQVIYREGILYPDLYITKLSTDFGYGTVGILMFYKRLLKDERKNFCLFLDELL